MPWVRLKRGGWCGFGRDDGPPPAVRLGWLRLDWLPESIAVAFARFENALRDGSLELKRQEAELAALREEARRPGEPPAPERW